MSHQEGVDPNGPPQYLKKLPTAEELQRWAEDHIDLQVISGHIQSVEGLVENKKNMRPLYCSHVRDDGNIIIESRGYQWWVWAGFATQTSNTVKTEIQKYNADRNPGRVMVVNLDTIFKGATVLPFVVEAVVNYWHELRLDMGYGKRMMVKRAVVCPDDAPHNQDWTDEEYVSGLNSLIQLHDAAYSLDDNLLKRLTENELRKRLIESQYNTSELLVTLETVYDQGVGKEKDRIMRRIFLSAAIVAHFGYSFDKKEGKHFREVQHWQPDFDDGMHKGLQWYFRMYLPSLRAKEE